MSMYKCRCCGNTGHLNDNLVGHFYENIMCISCLKEMPEPQKTEALEEIRGWVAEAHKQYKRAGS